jgi:hypothetical protein
LYRDDFDHLAMKNEPFSNNDNQLRYEAMGPNANDLPAQTLLQTKSPADSAVRVEYPFRRDRALRDRYVNCWGALDKVIALLQGTGR